MNSPLNVLLRIKNLKEERALRTVHIKRREVAEALSSLENSRSSVKQSAATLPAREDAIYRPIIGQIVNNDTIDDTKAKVQLLEKGHAKLIDTAERAAHVHARLEKQLTDAVKAHRKTVIERDKYVVLNEEFTAENNVKTTYREEIEFEDIFNTRHRRGP
jgi:ribosomal protein L17